MLPSGLGLASRRPLNGRFGIPRRRPAPSHGHVHATRYTLTTVRQSVIHHANQVLCATSQSRYFHGPCASLTVILSPCPVISALLRPLAFLLLLLLTCLVECLGHPRGSCIVHECLDCINSPPLRSSPRSMIGTVTLPRIHLLRY
jgi:hypothetical protein